MSISNCYLDNNIFQHFVDVISNLIHAKIYIKFTGYAGEVSLIDHNKKEKITTFNPVAQKDC